MRLMESSPTSASTLQIWVHTEMCRIGCTPGVTQAPGTEGGVWRKWVEMYSACTASSSSPNSVRSSSTVCAAFTACSAHQGKLHMVERPLARLTSDCYSITRRPLH